MQLCELLCCEELTSVCWQETGGVACNVLLVWVFCFFLTFLFTHLKCGGMVYPDEVLYGRIITDVGR